MIANVQPLFASLGHVILAFDGRDFGVELCQEVVSLKVESHEVVDVLDLQRIGAQQDQSGLLAES